MSADTRKSFANDFYKLSLEHLNYIRIKKFDFGCLSYLYSPSHFLFDVALAHISVYNCTHFLTLLSTIRHPLYLAVRTRIFNQIRKAKIRSFQWDRIGIVLSGICVIHCLALPVIVSALPLVAHGISHSHWFHALILILVIPTVVLALKQSNGRRRVVYLLIAGLLLIMAGLGSGSFGGYYHWETGLTVAGSILLVSGHVSNYLSHATCSVEHRHG